MEMPQNLPKKEKSNSPSMWKKKSRTASSSWQWSGIPVSDFPGENEYYFRVFHQADSSITRKYGGTGLDCPSVNKSPTSCRRGLAESGAGEGSAFISPPG